MSQFSSVKVWRRFNNYTRLVHIICSSLSPILWRLEELLFGYVVLQSCQIHHTRKACLPRSCSTTSCPRLGLKTSLELEFEVSALPLFFKERWKIKRQTGRLVLCCLIPSQFCKHLHNIKFISPSVISSSSPFSFTWKYSFFSCVHIILCSYLSSLQKKFMKLVNKFVCFCFHSRRGVRFLVFSFHWCREHRESLTVTENLFHGTNYKISVNRTLLLRIFFFAGHRA